MTGVWRWQGAQLEAGILSVPEECWYLPKLSEAIIGVPYVDSNSVKDSYFSITRTGAADLSSTTGTNGVDQTIAIDDSLQGKAYPYPIWTIYEPTAWQTGTPFMPGNGAAPSRTKTANLNGVLTPNTAKYHTRGIYPIQDDRNKIKQFYDYFPVSAIWITLIASFLTSFPSRNSNARYPI